MIRNLVYIRAVMASVQRPKPNTMVKISPSRRDFGTTIWEAIVMDY